MAGAESSAVGLKTFEFENHVKTLDASDHIFNYDAQEQKQLLNQKKWINDPHFFKKVKVAGTALIKMVMHARSGGQYEIMGLMQGKIDGDSFVVMDSFALPVQGTETRVNAASEANEYMVEFLERSKSVGRPENVVGWYHSHPGYGCWLSGIDVNTQLTNQTYTDPFVAIVIDPNRTVSAGRVDIGAFRTYPQGYTPASDPTNQDNQYQSIPLNKIEDFGAHSNSYYSLEVEHFKSSSDTNILNLLWKKYWMMTLSQSSSLSNRAYTSSQIHDMTAKLKKAEPLARMRCQVECLIPTSMASNADHKSIFKQQQSTPLSKVMKDAEKIQVHHHSALISQLIKDALFNRNPALDNGDCSRLELPEM